jgi:hypothetical protein
MTRLRVFAWASAALAAALNVAGYAASLYQIPGFDVALHAVTIFALTLVLAVHMRPALPGAWRPASHLAILVALGVALGAAWEIAEWTFDALTSGNAIRGKTDTMTDLVADGAGAALAAWLALTLERRRPRIV